MTSSPMIGLEYEMTYAETIDGPLGPTSGSPLGERLCWQITNATLRGPRIDATLTMPGTDWIRLGSDGIRRSSKRFVSALASGAATEFADQYMRIAPHFEVGAGRYAWLTESLFLGRGRLTGPRAIAYELDRVL